LGKERIVDLDKYEVKILRLLQEDAGLSNAEIAEQVGLSASPCWRRIDRLALLWQKCIFEIHKSRLS
jgi:DNA-binding Lrp family transcriptional regulator